MCSCPESRVSEFESGPRPGRSEKISRRGWRSTQPLVKRRSRTLVPKCTRPEVYPSRRKISLGLPLFPCSPPRLPPCLGPRATPAGGCFAGCKRDESSCTVSSAVGPVSSRASAYYFLPLKNRVQLQFLCVVYFNFSVDWKIHRQDRPWEIDCLIRHLPCSAAVALWTWSGPGSPR